ncbi:putative sulfate exporter family transporter [Chelativorans sp. AA-79]|uniref:YeiH family protein n=1 Tax=Chelativorans sp. AA-79 TaxID=3028735 RepID=UPI0023F73789|nr:putative sulfate exporter family transporter [Chelativorans sp. AA-79]WEX09810.1 putative sulfate exporter family transporter [Chelativorans sp. AA-79]
MSASPPAMRLQHLKSLAPGIMLALLIALAATFLSEHYGAPVMLFALLLGMAFHFLWDEPRSAAGIDFASRSLLRLGVGLLGARITFEEIGALGFGPILLVLASVVATIGFGLLMARLFRRHWTFGILTGGAVAICGASAALAISAVLPNRPEREKDTLFTVIAVTGLSTIAMIIYPILFAALGFDDREIGVMIGATIHDVAQVVGAGYAVSDVAGDTATFVKLLRVALLPIVVISIMLFARRGEGAKGLSLPSFVVLFAALVVLNSLGFIPTTVAALLSELSRWLLVVAIAALGVKTALKDMFALGAGHINVVVTITLFLMMLALGLSLLL